MKNLKIILPIEETPAIISKNIHAIRLSIIQKCDEHGINYVYNNYIQLFFKIEKKGQATFDYVFPKYKDLSTFRTCSVDKPTFTINSLNIKDFIIRGLLCKKYIITSVDEYYIPNRLAYNKFNFGHDVLLYGYDSQNNIFHIIGYTDSGYYQPSIINCDEFIIAYLNSYGNKSIELVETVSYYHHRIEIELIIASLEDYITSGNKSRLFDKSKWLDDNETYGINTIEKIKNYLDAVADNRINIDRRIMYTLMEHKKIMLERYKHLIKNHFIVENKEIEDELIKIYKQSQVSLNLFLKYIISYDVSLLSKIQNILDDIKNKELITIPDFISHIKQGVINEDNNHSI